MYKDPSNTSFDFALSNTLAAVANSIGLAFLSSSSNHTAISTFERMPKYILTNGTRLGKQLQYSFFSRTLTAKLV